MDLEVRPPPPLTGGLRADPGPPATAPRQARQRDLVEAAQRRAQRSGRGGVCRRPARTRAGRRGERGSHGAGRQPARTRRHTADVLAEPGPG